MANEAVKVEGPYEVHDFTVSSGTTISAMSLCTLADNRTALGSTASTNPGSRFAGIAMTEKASTSNATELGLATKGVFKLTACTGATISAGNLVQLSGANLIVEADTSALLSGCVIGKAWENIASAGTGEVHVGETI